MVVPLPPQPAGNTALPQPPQNPPTLNNIADGVDYNRRIRASRRSNVATPHDVAHGAIYEASLIAENAAVVPGLAAALAAALAATLPAALAAALPAALPAALAATLPVALPAALAAALPAALPAALTAALPVALDPLLAPILRTSGIAYNLQCGDGLQRPFEIIPFLNGQDPTQGANALPALRNENVISLLLPHETTAYLVGYGIQPIPHLIAARKTAIRVQIGCSIGV